MPICKNCSNSFPKNTIIDGKIRNLQRRKYCFECSPFGKHNTSQIHLNKNQYPNANVCKQCKKHYIYKRRSGTSTQYCASCMVNRQRERKKNKCIEYMGGKCQRCGYNKCNRSLCFHHKNPTTKLFHISGNHCRSWEVLQTELDKCIMLCMNCHGEIHEELDGQKDKRPQTMGQTRNRIGGIQK